MYKFMGKFKYSKVKSINNKKIFIRYKTKINLDKYIN